MSEGRLIEKFNKEKERQKDYDNKTQGTNGKFYLVDFIIYCVNILLILYWVFQLSCIIRADRILKNYIERI